MVNRSTLYIIYTIPSKTGMPLCGLYADVVRNGEVCAVVGEFKPCDKKALEVTVNLVSRFIVARTTKKIGEGIYTGWLLNGLEEFYAIKSSIKDGNGIQDGNGAKELIISRISGGSGDPYIERLFGEEASQPGRALLIVSCWNGNINGVVVLNTGDDNVYKEGFFDEQGHDAADQNIASVDRFFAKGDDAIGSAILPLAIFTLVRSVFEKGELNKPRIVAVTNESIVKRFGLFVKVIQKLFSYIWKYDSQNDTLELVQDPETYYKVEINANRVRYLDKFLSLLDKIPNIPVIGKFLYSKIIRLLSKIKGFRTIYSGHKIFNQLPYVELVNGIFRVHK